MRDFLLNMAYGFVAVVVVAIWIAFCFCIVLGIVSLYNWLSSTETTILVSKIVFSAVMLVIAGAGMYKMGESIRETLGD